MDTQGAAIGSQGLKKDRSHAQTGAPLSEALGQGGIQVNGPASHGPNGELPNGVPAVNGNVATTNGEYSDATMAYADESSIPELDQSWRSTDANKSLGTLMDRLAQQCYFDLNDTLTKMSEKGSSQTAPQANGVLPHAAQDTDSNSLEKKRMLLEFAHDQRDRFIKTLVLSDWSKNEEEMARLIDIKVEQDKQRFAYKFAANSIAELKRRTIGFKRQAPNIEGAIELLATSKAAWVPDLGYIPPKRLSAKQLLRTLKNMNVTLATRLNLHEELPYHMQEFTIANGRATFIVPGEFEVDLSVADEDPTSTFYFIDIRLLFQPSSDILDERLRPHLEAQVNEALRTKRLQGCYDVLHNFVLTHKINVLRSQAAELIRGKWFDCISVENLRRTMVVRYWCGMPGAKSWFEIGVASGKEKAGPRRKPTPALAVRWFRKGLEVKDEQLELDWTNLDLETCLATVIGKHAASILDDIRKRMQPITTTEEHKALSVEVKAIDIEVADAALTFKMPSLHSPLTLRIDCITGQYSISPPSAATLNREPVLNSDPALDVSRHLTATLCAAVQEHVEKQAELLGWSKVDRLGRIRSEFGRDVVQWNVFSPSQGWGQNWALGISYSLGTERWWAVQLESEPSDSSSPTFKTILAAKQIPVPESLWQDSKFSSASLLQIERLAVAEVSSIVLFEQLRTLQIPHHFEKLAMADQAGKDSPQPLTAVSSAFFVQFSAFMQKVEGKNWGPWADDSLRLTHYGLEHAGEVNEEGAPALVRHDLRLSLKAGKMKHLQQYLSRSHDQDIAINGTGALAVRVRAPFGKPFIEQIQKRLLSIERLDGFVATLQRQQFTCTTVSLARLVFAYDSAAHLSARLAFSNDGSLPARVKFEPADSNPHTRIRVTLEEELNRPVAESFRNFALSLSLTLPLLRAIERLEADHLARRTLLVRIHSATWYHLGYKAPFPRCVFQIRARARMQGERRIIRWHVEVAKDKIDASSWPEDLEKALKEVWQDKGEGWVGIGNGVIAEVGGIGPLLEKLDKVVRRFESSDEASKPAEPTSQSAEEPAKDPAKQPDTSIPATTSRKEPDVIMLDD